MKKLASNSRESARFNQQVSDSGSIELAQQALTAYREIPIKFIDVSLDQALDISHSLNIYAYDVYLIQCALQTSTPLLTLDNGLITAAHKMGVQTLEVAK